MKTPIIFMESIPVTHNLDTGLSTGNWLFKRYDFIDENHDMSEGERQAWVINGKATTDLEYHDKQGNIYEEGDTYFNNVHVWKRVNGNPSVLYVSSLPTGQVKTSNAWVESEWEVV